MARYDDSQHYTPDYDDDCAACGEPYPRGELAWNPAGELECTRCELRRAVDEEEGRLNRRQGVENAPMGGWRNRAVEAIAKREGMNPYTLDRIVTT